MKLKDEGLDEEAMDMIAAEDLRQREKWGFQEHSADVWFIILSEEVGELAAVLLQGDEPDLSALEEEATQIATIAIKMAYMARKERLLPNAKVRSKDKIDRLKQKSKDAMGSGRVSEAVRLYNQAWAMERDISRSKPPDSEE